MIREQLQRQLVTTIQRAKLENHLDAMVSNACECAYFRYTSYKVIEDPAIGGSRIGGAPDLPLDIQWPPGMDREGREQGQAKFLAQFNLSEIPEFEGNPLPRQGMLWVFARAWGIYVDAPIMAIYAATNEKLVRRSRPVATEANPLAFGAMPIRFEIGAQLPWYRKSFRNVIDEAGDGYEIYRCRKRLREAAEENLYPIAGHVGGYATYAEDRDYYRWLAYRDHGRTEYYRASSFDTMAEYEETLARMRKSRAAMSPEDPSAALLPVEKLEALRPHVEWALAHRAEIDSAAASWKLLVNFNDALDHLGIDDPESLDVFIRKSDLEHLDFSHLEGEMPLVG